MTTDTPAVPAYRIPSAGTRTVLLTNLRPGDWLVGPTGLKFCVYRNLKRYESLHLYDAATGQQNSFSYRELVDSVRHCGRGKPRVWMSYLPDFLTSSRCIYTSP